MKYLLGIDFGGGASKATLLDVEGRITAESTVEYPTLYPENGACEQSPEDWIAALCKNTASLLSQSGVNAADILAVAIDSATHTSLVCDEAFRPLRPAMHWTDSRSRLQANRLREAYGEEIFAKTFHKPDTIWTLPQLLWLREHEAELFSKIRYVFFEKDYIRYFLTGVFCTDYIEAEGSMLFDYNTLDWSEKLMELASVTRDMLPTLVRPDEIVGHVTEKAAAETGLYAGTPVLCGTTDTVMEVLASGSVGAGQMTIKLATAGRICIITDRAYRDRDIINYSHVIEGLWYPGTATKACASSYRWYRDTFGEDYRELDAAAAQVPAGSEGLLYHPYLNGELTPYADPLLCGSFTGIRFSHTKGHFSRAVMEGVALSLLDCKKKIEALGIPHADTAAIIGGGSYSPLWRQIVADTLGIELVKKNNSDSSLGSAIMAGVKAGVFASYEDALAKCTVEEGRTVPNPENGAVYAKLYEKYKAVHDALEDVYHKYSAI